MSLTPEAIKNIDQANLKFTQLLDYDGGTHIVYFGEALPNSVTSAPVWRIKKFTYDGSYNITSIKWADGKSDRTKIWDNRATYTYT